MYNFDYLIEKINRANFIFEPFKNIYIENFLSKEHFDNIINTTEVRSIKAKNDKDLIDGLINKGYLPIEFPGCTTDLKKYISWHENKKKMSDHHSACSGFGVAFRLYHFESEILKELNKFLTSKKFNEALALKIGADIKTLVVDGGIQKYLDKYEISPHPDIRKKVATYMVNINHSKNSETLNYHTSYLKFKKKYKYVEEFWRGNQNIDRAWVPWEWTDVIKKQVKNNSIVIFYPSDETMHAVKCDYDHLKTQRTQLYGNLWHDNNQAFHKFEWEQLDLFRKNVENKKTKTLKEHFASILPLPIKQKIKNFLSRTDIGKRKL
jgi:hypothetical protein